jgi:hypothetical protein
MLGVWVWWVMGCKCKSNNWKAEGVIPHTFAACVLTTARDWLTDSTTLYCSWIWIVGDAIVMRCWRVGDAREIPAIWARFRLFGSHFFHEKWRSKVEKQSQDQAFSISQMEVAPWLSRKVLTFFVEKCRSAKYRSTRSSSWGVWTLCVDESLLADFCPTKPPHGGSFVYAMRSHAWFTACPEK